MIEVGAAFLAVVNCCSFAFLVGFSASTLLLVLAVAGSFLVLAAALLFLAGSFLVRLLLAAMFRRPFFYSSISPFPDENTKL